MKSYQYSAVETPLETSSHSNADTTGTQQCWSEGRNRLQCCVVSVAVLAAILFLLDWSLLKEEEEEVLLKNSIRMPSGVNFGSWLSLEDYFFAGGGAVEVATPDDKTVAACLPPLHTGQGPRWQSETDLLASLVKQYGMASALKVFHAHRVSFIDWEDDLATLAQLGVKHVRVPLSWCLTDHDPTTIDPHDNSTTDETLARAFTCQDHFFNDVQWPAIPRGLIARFLRACAAHDIKASLDIHTYPGATSIGTFSGLWPRWPRFWTHGDSPDAPQEDIGRGLLRDFIHWMESLAETDPEAFKGLLAISPMNEPAHLAGLFGPGGAAMPNKTSFLPDLAPGMAKSFLAELNSLDDDSLTQVPDGPHLRVFLWLRDAIQLFRESSLPALGKEMHVNIHESILRPSVLPPNDGNDFGGRHPGATQILAAWWRGITAAEERSSWAVLDMHHYHAWEPSCQGASDGPPEGNYTCGNNEGRRDALERCTSWSQVFRDAIDEECGPGAKLVSAEFSASTHHLVRHACNDVDTLRASYTAQIEAASKANVNLFWWSYKMPYGGAFRPAWSFKHFLYLLGVTAHPDETAYDCGEHVARSDAPTDGLGS